MTEALEVEVSAHIGALTLDVRFTSSSGALVVVGPNGAGKTSLLSLVLGARTVERGRITIGETVLLDTQTGVDLPLEARQLGYVPQNYALFPHLTVRRNLEFAIQSAAPTASRAERAERARRLLSDLDLEAHQNRAPDTLSGGERQRVALARALSIEPRALLLDEPLAALDVGVRREVRSFLASYLRKLDLPSLLVTHDPNDARVLGHRILVLEAGRVTQIGSWAELEAAPASCFVAHFVKAAG